MTELEIQRLNTKPGTECTVNYMAVYCTETRKGKGAQSNQEFFHQTNVMKMNSKTYILRFAVTFLNNQINLEAGKMFQK